MKRRMVAALLAVSMTASIGISATAAKAQVDESVPIESMAVYEGATAYGMENPFADIGETDYYYKEVLWGCENGIVSGLSANRFAPTASCTRGQIATFLWRAEGKKTADNKTVTFRDVSPESYYYDAIAWAVEQGIISGYNAKTFGAEDICTRAQLVTILHRLAGNPDADTEKMMFKDVDADAYYYNAVAWAVEQGIANGYSPKTFGSDDKILRCDTVKLLYGYYQLEDGDKDTEPDIDVEQKPMISPTVTPEATPSVSPEATPEVTPTVSPEVPPEKNPDDLEPDKDLEIEEDKDSDKEQEKEDDKDSDKESEKEDDKNSEKEEGKTPDQDKNQEPELSEVDKAFPWNDAFAAEVVEVAKTYLEHAEDFRYQAGYGAFGNTYIDREDGKGLIDCSTFIGLVLRGIPYEKSRYVTNSIWDNMARTDLYQWADSGLDGAHVRWAYEFADYFIEEERIFEDLSSVKPADVLIHHKTDAVTGEESVWHVSMVMEIEDDGDIICIHSLYGKKDVGIYTYRLTDAILEKYGRTIAARPDYAKKDKMEYYVHSWVLQTENE